MEEKKKEEKIIYPSPLEDLIADDGEFLYLEKGTTNCVSFIEGDDLRIPKDYLLKILRRRFCREVESNEDCDEFFLEDLTDELLKSFDTELGLFMELFDEPTSCIENDYSFNDVIKSYIAYVLKSELYREYRRINFVIQAVAALELSDKTEYYSRLIHAVENPGEGEKERLRHQKEIEAEMELWRQAKQEAKKKVREESKE